MADARRVDEYGEHVHGQGGYDAGMGGHGTTQVHEGMTGGQHQPQRVEGHGTGTMGQVLQRSGSSSSSDDGMGGRRKKKGLKEKIKEKIPGGHKTDQAQTHTPTTTPVGTTGTTTTTAGTGQHYGEQHEKKGTMEKIKEKLPGGH